MGTLVVTKKKPKKDYMERKNMLNIFNRKRKRESAAQKRQGNIPHGGETYFANAKIILQILNLIQTSNENRKERITTGQRRKLKDNKFNSYNF